MNMHNVFASVCSRRWTRSGIHRVTLVVIAVALGTSSPAWAGFRAGAALLDITPPLGTEISGGTRPVLARQVHDPLHARALALDDGVCRLAFVVVDTCLLGRDTCDEAKALIERHTGIPSTNVCISAVHTHSGGSAVAAHLTEGDEPYRRWLVVRLADAVRCAVNNLAPAQAAWGSGSLPQHVFCRRILVKAGVTYTNLLGFTGDGVKMNWSSPEPDIDGGFSGPVDPQVSFLSLRHADGRPLALLANYSLHYVGGVGPGHLSADYFGVFCERMTELLDAGKQDPPFVAMLCNGTSGDVNNIDYRVKQPSREPYVQIKRVADDLAQEVLRVLQPLAHRTNITLRAAALELPVKVRKPSAEEVFQARTLVNGRDRLQLKTWSEIYARETLIMADFPDKWALPLQVFRIGDLAIAQWPGEIFAVSGLDLKARSPIRPLFNIELANGWYGYIPPPAQHALGSYETWRGRTSPLETNAIPQITDALLRLLAGLK